MMYRVCPECGAYLDPGESCDCQSIEKAASDGNDTESGTENKSTYIISEGGEIVK